jgi:hypothetical protein
MSIEEISKERFDSYNPLRHRPADNALTLEVSWFENPEADAIGVIVKDKRYEDYSVVSLASRDGFGFTVYDATVAIPTISEAEEGLRAALQVDRGASTT